MERLPVWRTVLASYRFTFANLGPMVRLGWAWMLVALGARLGSLALGEGEAVAFGATVLAGLAEVGFAVSWHRAILAGDRPEGFRTPAWGRREIRYFLLGAPWALAFGGLERLGDGLHALASAWLMLMLAGSLVLLFAMSRCILAFPAAALGDDRFGPWESWLATRGNGWRLMGGSILAMGFLFPVQFLEGLGPGANVLSRAVGTICGVGLEFLGMAVILVFISFGYHDLRKGSDSHRIP